MSDRTTKVTLVAQAHGYVAGMDQASNATKRAAAEAKHLADQQAALVQTTRDVGVGLVAFGSLAAAGVALAVKSFAEFDKSMSAVHAATQENAEGMGALRDAALEAGNTTQYSATQAADAITELGKAGLSTQDILAGGLSASLNLAAADNLELATAAGIAATTMQQFGLQGKDLAHVSDLLAAGANKALGGVEDLANGLKFVGPVAAGMGISIEETTAALASFASQGVLGEQAGTTLRGVLSSLTSPSAMARTELDKLGVTLYDSQGKFLGLTNLAGQLSAAYSDMSDAQRDMSLGVIFGNQQITGARLLYMQGAEGMKEWTEAVDDSGFAAKVAAQQMDNLEGDVTKLGNTLNTALIQTGANANDVLRGLTQSVTDMVKGFNDSGPVVQSGVLVLGAVTAAAALAGGGFLLLVPKIRQAQLAMEAMNITGLKLAKGFGKGGLVLVGLTALAGAFAGVGSMGSLAADEVARLNAALSTDKLKELNKEFVDAYGNTSSFAQALNTLFTSDFWNNYQGGPAQVNGAIKAITFGLVDLGAWADTNRAKFDQLGQALGSLAAEDLPTATARFNDLVSMTDGSDESVRQLLVAFPQYAAALRDLAADQGVTLKQQDLMNLAQGKGELAARLAAAATDRQAVKLGTLSAAAEDATGDINELSGAIRDFGKAQFDTNAATRQFEQAIDDATASVETNGAGLDLNTQKGRDNQAALDAIASSANQLAATIYDQTGSIDDATAALERGRESYISVGLQMGLTRDQAEAYAAALIATPDEITTAVVLQGLSEAERQLNAWIVRNDGRRIRFDAEMVLHPGQVAAHAEGGTVRGPGGPKSDSVLIRASAGEEIIQEPHASRFRPQLKAINAGVVPRFADGGTVPGFSPAPVYVSAPAPQMSLAGGGLTVQVVVRDSVVGDEDLLAKTVTRAVTNAVRNGSISGGWNG